MNKNIHHTPGARHDAKTGQWFPTVNGVDASPTSFDEARALDTASQIVIAALLTQRNELLETLQTIQAAWESGVDAQSRWAHKVRAAISKATR